MKTVPSYKLLFLLILTLTAAQAEHTGLIEKRKTFVKVYDVQARDQLSVDNQFGQVKVNVWDRKEIRVDITVTANAPTDQRATDYLRAISIQEKREGNLISLLTSIDNDQFGSGSWNLLRAKSGEKNFIQIDYVISMPRGNALIVKNKFGNTDIASFQAPLSVLSRYGDFSANELNNGQNTIEVQYGNATIGKMDGGKINVKYSNLQLDRARTLLLVNKFGKLNIGEVGTLDADIGYSGASIGSVSGSCNIKLSYSGSFQINQLSRNAENVDIQAAYSSVTLPAESNQFNVTVTHGNFRLPSNANVSFTQQPDKTEATRSTKQYSGKVGIGNGTTIRVVSKFGDVRLKE